MTLDNITTEQAARNAFAALAKNQFVQLTTYRKSGVGVHTPVWFAYADGTIYVMTPGKAGKLKRIRNNGRATLAPCKSNGQVTGESVECVASILSEQEQGVANKTLARKYGLLYRIFAGLQKVRGGRSTYIAIQLAQS